MPPPSTPKIRQRNLHPSPTNSHNPSSSLNIHGADTDISDDSGKFHGRTKRRRDELLKSNRRMVFLGGILAGLALCSVGLWALNISLGGGDNAGRDRRPDNDGGKGTKGERDYVYGLDRRNTAGKAKKIYPGDGGKKYSKERKANSVRDGDMKDQSETNDLKEDREERKEKETEPIAANSNIERAKNLKFSEYTFEGSDPLPNIPAEIEDEGPSAHDNSNKKILHHRKKLGSAKPPRRSEDEEIMEIYRHFPLPYMELAKAEKTSTDDFDASEKAPPREESDRDHNDVKAEENDSGADASSDEGSRKSTPKFTPDRTKGERPMAAVPLPAMGVDMKRWGYDSRPRVVNCQFERVSSNAADKNRTVDGNDESDYEDDLYDTYFVIASVNRLPHHEKQPLLASKRILTPYPDGDDHATSSGDFMERMQEIKKNSKKYRQLEREPSETDECTARHDWQDGSYPNCNTMHEYELASRAAMYGRMLREGLNPQEGDGDEQVRYWAHGYWRDVWLIAKTLEATTDREDGEEIAVLKTLRYKHDFTDRNYDRHRKDSLASMRLSNSPNIVDIYGYCSNSAIFEYGNGGDIDEKLFPWDSKARKYLVTKLSSWEQIDIAYQVARAIADMHDVENDGFTSIAHTDITPSQFIFIKGRWKLNDFNRCRFMRKYKSDNSPCGFFVGSNPGKFRAPEEYSYEEEDEMIDIYSMGNIFYSIVAGEMPYDDLKEDEAQKKIRHGERPEVPKEVLNSDDEAIQAIISAMKRCWAQNPRDRPKASVIRDEFEEVMNRIRNGKGDEALNTDTER